MVFPFPSCGGASGAANSGPSVLLGRSRVTLSRRWSYAGIRQVLPGSQSRRRPETHRRGQPLQSEARNAKNAPESAICGVLPIRPAPTGSVLWLVPISSSRTQATTPNVPTPPKRQPLLGQIYGDPCFHGLRTGDAEGPPQRHHALTNLHIARPA